MAPISEDQYSSCSIEASLDEFRLDLCAFDLSPAAVDAVIERASDACVPTSYQSPDESWSLAEKLRRATVDGLITKFGGENDTYPVRLRKAAEVLGKESPILAAVSFSSGEPTRVGLEDSDLNRLSHRSDPPNLEGAGVASYLREIALAIESIDGR